MKVCGYCHWYQGFANKRQYGICKVNKSEYPDGGTFSTNTCPSFEHWRMHNKSLHVDQKSGAASAK